jgi:hypothetical protein
MEIAKGLIREKELVEDKRLLLASCGTSTTTTTTTFTTTTVATTTSAAVAGTTILTVTEGSQTKTYSLADLQALPSVSGYGGQISMGNTITGPDSYQVSLITLLNAMGGITSGQNVIITGSDNYSQTLSYQQVTTDNFTLFDAVMTCQNRVTQDSLWVKQLAKIEVMAAQ